VAEQGKEVNQMKTILLIAIVLVFAAIAATDNEINCSFAQSSDDLGPERLVVIKGKATIVNHPDLGVTPATSETLIFQKVGCSSCYIGANVGIDGNYKIVVGDGKYKIIVNDQSSQDVDLLAPDQERFIDTGNKNSANRVFEFNVRIKLPK
jgi:hypothetical protein